MSDEQWFVYELSEGAFRDWYYWGVGESSKMPTRREVGQFAKAIIILSHLIPGKNWFDSPHEYWTTYFPGAGAVIILRPESNPFAEGYLISRVELAWLTLKGKVRL
jgi:hypothetical protein